MAISITPIAKAQARAPSITLSPNSGPVNTIVSVNGTGFAPNSPVSICFVSGNNALLLAYSSGTDPNGNLAAQGNVPSDLAAGTYVVSATDASSDTATSTFTVSTGGVAPVTIPTSAPSSTIPPYSTPQPTYAPPVQSAGGISGLLIGGIVAVVAVAIIIPMFFVLRSRGGGSRRDKLLEREQPSPFREQPNVQQPAPGYGQPAPGYNQPSSGYRSGSYQPSSRYQPRSYGQPSITPGAPSRYGQPSSYRQPSSYAQQPMSGGKTCPNCHRAVRADYSICPYCYKRMR